MNIFKIVMVCIIVVLVALVARWVASYFFPSFIGGGFHKKNEIDADADKALFKLADAFEKKDIDTIEQVVFDPRSTLRRYAINWGDEYFKPIAAALRDAKLKSSSPKERIYEITIKREGSAPETRELVLFLRDDRGWIMNYEKFQISPL